MIISGADIDWSTSFAAVWRSRSNQLKPVQRFSALPLERLLNMDRQKAALIHNTERFLHGRPSNHALLWGSRGTGKSALIKSLLYRYHPRGLRMLEVPKDSLDWLPEISDLVADLPWRFIIFCDDLSFAAQDTRYQGLKPLLEGSLESPPDNVRIYATSNRRHLLPESMLDNQVSVVAEGGELHLGDAVEEKIALADRFGLSLSFYTGNQQAYLLMVRSYFAGYQGDWAELEQAACRFARERGSYSGRTAVQFYNHLAHTE